MSIQRRLNELEKQKDETTGLNTVDAVEKLLPAIGLSDKVELNPDLRAHLSIDLRNTVDSAFHETHLRLQKVRTKHQT